MKIRTWYTVWAVSDRKVSPAELWRALHPSVGGVIAEPAFTRETWDALRCKVVIEGCHETPSFDMTEHCVFRVEQTGEVLVQIRWGIDPIVVGRKSAEMQTWVDAMDGEPNRESILAHLRQTQQIITISPIPQTVGIAKLGRICEQLCGYLARECQGLIHVEAAGIFGEDGHSVVPHNSKHRLKTD